MPQQYFAEWDCGQRIRVELFDAGTRKVCTSCHATVAVPSSTKLKELTGDKYPLLTPIEKIQRTVANAEPPFDGHCHVCLTADANFQVPISFKVLVERHIGDSGGVRPTMTGGIELVAGGPGRTLAINQLPVIALRTLPRQV